MPFWKNDGKSRENFLTPGTHHKKHLITGAMNTHSLLEIMVQAMFASFTMAEKRLSPKLDLALFNTTIQEKFSKILLDQEKTIKQVADDKPSVDMVKQFIDDAEGTKARNLTGKKRLTDRIAGIKAFQTVDQNFRKFFELDINEKTYASKILLNAYEKLILALNNLSDDKDFTYAEIAKNGLKLKIEKNGDFSFAGVNNFRISAELRTEIANAIVEKLPELLPEIYHTAEPELFKYCIEKSEEECKKNPNYNNKNLPKDFLIDFINSAPEAINNKKEVILYSENELRKKLEAFDSSKNLPFDVNFDSMVHYAIILFEVAKYIYAYSSINTRINNKNEVSDARKSSSSDNTAVRKESHNIFSNDAERKTKENKFNYILKKVVSEIQTEKAQALLAKAFLEEFIRVNKNSPSIISYTKEQMIDELNKFIANLMTNGFKKQEIVLRLHACLTATPLYQSLAISEKMLPTFEELKITAIDLFEETLKHYNNDENINTSLDQAPSLNKTADKKKFEEFLKAIVTKSSSNEGLFAQQMIGRLFLTTFIQNDYEATTDNGNQVILYSREEILKRLFDFTRDNFLMDLITGEPIFFTEQERESVLETAVDLFVEASSQINDENFIKNSSFKNNKEITTFNSNSNSASENNKVNNRTNPLEELKLNLPSPPAFLSMQK